MENKAYSRSHGDNASIGTSSIITIEKTEKTEADVWGELIGDDKPWAKMTTAEKWSRIFLNSSKLFAIMGFMYFFICSLDVLSISFRMVAGQSTGNLMNNEYVSNPIVGLMIGILLTVLVQSSSTSTSIIVSMVAASILTVHTAVPMVMGANIGTSVTNTIVSLTQAGDREQFRRAFAGATVHDMFNWLCVGVMLPLEVLTGFLEKLTSAIVGSLVGSEGMEVKMLSVLTDPLVDLIIQIDSLVVECWGMGMMQDVKSMIKKYCDEITINTTLVAPSTTTMLPTTNSSSPDLSKCEPDPNTIGIPHSCHFLFYETTMSDVAVGTILLFASLIVLCTALIIVVKLLNSMLKGSIAKVIQKVINSDIPYVPWLTGYVAICIGAILTFIVQSSSVFTSTLTPLIGLGIITVNRAYPLTLGSNIGTTTTGLLAAMASSGEQMEAIQIALVHLFFNIFGISLFYPIPFMRWPLPMCKKLGYITSKYRWFAGIYILFMFFLIPGSIFALSLGGKIVLWSVFGPVLIILGFAVIVNIMQNKCTDKLPEALQSWDWLPKPLHSLQPYDALFLSLPCCQKCKPEDTLVESERSTSHSDVDNSTVTPM